MKGKGKNNGLGSMQRHIVEILDESSKDGKGVGLWFLINKLYVIQHEIERHEMAAIMVAIGGLVMRDLVRVKLYRDAGKRPLEGK